MANIKSFKGLRYNLSKFSDLNPLTAPPYDVISPAAQQEYLDKSAYNIVHLDFGKQHPDDSDSDNKYTRAGELLNEWICRDVLIYEQNPAIYLYDQIFTVDGVRRSRRGIICLVKIEEFSKGVILPHEETLSKAKTDRFNLMKTTHSNLSQIFSLYMDEDGRISEALEVAHKQKPDISFKSDDDITENIWIITDETLISSVCKLFEDKQIFIADGHHRYETALNFRNKYGSEFDYVMMMLVDMDDDGLVVFPTHRMLKNIENFDEQAVINNLEDNFTVQKLDGQPGQDSGNFVFGASTGKRDSDKAVFYFYTGKDYHYRLEYKDNGAMRELLPDKSDAYINLDVSILHTLVLEKLFNIDALNMSAQKNLQYTRDSAQAIAQAKSGECQCCFLLNATKVEEIKDVSLAGEKMPQKSTYFYPKLTTGIVVNRMTD